MVLHWAEGSGRVGMIVLRGFIITSEPLTHNITHLLLIGGNTAAETM